MDENITRGTCPPLSSPQELHPRTIWSSRSWLASPSRSFRCTLPGDEPWRMKQIARGVSSCENAKKPQVQHITNTELDVARLLEERKDLVEVRRDNKSHAPKEDWLFAQRDSNEFESAPVGLQKIRSDCVRKRPSRSTWTTTGRFLCHEAMVFRGPSLPAVITPPPAQSPQRRMTRTEVTEERIISAACKAKPPTPQLFVKSSQVPRWQRQCLVFRGKNTTPFSRSQDTNMQSTLADAGKHALEILPPHISTS